MRRKALLGLIAAVIAVAVGASPAAAHVSLVGSDPADATSLRQVPKEVRLRFNEPVSSRFRQVRLLDARGHAVGGSRLSASPDGRQLILSLPPTLPRGAYEVTWEALSQDDGHVSGGALVFGAGAAVGPAPLAAPVSGATTLDAALRWVVLTLLLGLTGLVAMGLVLVRGRFAGNDASVRADALARVVRPLAPLAAGSAFVGLAVLAREADTVPGSSGMISAAGHLLGERWGAIWIATEVLLIVLVAAGTSARRRPDSAILSLSAGILVGICALRAANGHAAVVAQPTLHVIAATAHLVAAGIWLGGVAAFTMLLWPTGRAMAPGAATLVRAIRLPFSLLAGGALVVAAFTGLVAFGAQVASVDALLTTSYGESLLVKVGLMLIAAGVGLVNAIVLLRLGRDGAGAPGVRVPRLMAIEAALGVGALLAAGQVTASAPPRGPEFGAPRPVRAPLLARQTRDILIGTTLRPNRVGTNVITVTTPSSRRGLGSPVRSVTLLARPTLAAPSATQTIRMVAGGEDRWTSGAVLRSAGGWRMSVVVQRADGERLVAPLALTVDPADRVLPVKYSARRTGPIATALQWALIGSIVLGLAALALRFRLRRRSADGTLSGSFDAV